jgi:hypothetical protein
MSAPWGRECGHPRRARRLEQHPERVGDELDRGREPIVVDEDDLVDQRRDPGE